jgi:hypothetical protein
MQSVKMTMYQASTRLRQAAMHPTVHKLIIDRIDTELAKWDLDLADRFNVLYYLTEGETASAIHDLSVILPNKEGDIRRDKLLLIVDFTLTRTNRIKAIKGVRVPRKRLIKKEPPCSQ